MRSTYPMPVREAVVTLSGGRRLGYAAWGPEDGRPLFFFHGWPGSRLVARLVARAAVDAGFRLIAPDRPGMGLSDFQPGRRMLDWPADIAGLADALGIERFAVAGYSGGGPYALACARASRTATRLTGVALISSMGPVDTRGARRTLPLPMRASFAAAGRAPRLAIPVVGAIARGLGGISDRGFRRAMAFSCAADRAMLARPNFVAVAREDMAESFRQGPKGDALELKINAAPWGFRPEDISAEVLLFHGEEDRNVPVAIGRHLAARLPRCRPHFIPGAGHTWLARGFDRVVAEL